MIRQFLITLIKDHRMYHNLLTKRSFQDTISASELIILELLYFLGVSLTKTSSPVVFIMTTCFDWQIVLKQTAWFTSDTSIQGDSQAVWFT